MAFEFALDAILLQALQNPKDRTFILGSERTCESLFHPSLQYNKQEDYFRIRKAQFPPMNSYFRMLMHRIARYYGLIHLADSKTGVVTLTVSNESRLPLVRLAELVEREDLFTTTTATTTGNTEALNKSNGTTVRLVRRGEGASESEGSTPSSLSEQEKKEKLADKPAPPSAETTTPSSPPPPPSSSTIAEQSDQEAIAEADESNLRVHYSESTNDAAIPRHILQVTIPNKTASTTTADLEKMRSFAASKLNAELRADKENILLIFQSCNAAEKALEANPFKPAFGATLEAWSPFFFPTSMF